MFKRQIATRSTTVILIAAFTLSSSHVFAISNTLSTNRNDNKGDIEQKLRQIERERINNASQSNGFDFGGDDIAPPSSSQESKPEEPPKHTSILDSFPEIAEKEKKKEENLPKDAPLTPPPAMPVSTQTTPGKIGSIKSIPHASGKADIVIMAPSIANSNYDNGDILSSKLADAVQAYYKSQKPPVPQDIEIITDNINDFVSRTKCDPTEPKCIQSLAQQLSTPTVIFSTLQTDPSNTDRFKLRIAEYSFEKQKFTRELSEVIIDPTVGYLENQLQAAAETLIFGNTATLDIHVIGNKTMDSKLIVDGKEVPITDGEWVGKNLTYGYHDVKLTTKEGDVAQESFYITAGAPYTLTLNSDTPVQNFEEEPLFTSPFELPSYLSLSLGTAGLITGIIGSLMKSRAASNISTLCQSNKNHCLDYPAGPQLVNQQAVDDYKSYRDLGQQGLRLELIGYPIAAVGLLAAGALFYFHTVTKTQPKPKRVAFDLTPTTDGGVYGTLGFIF